MTTTETLLTADGLTKLFPVGRGLRFWGQKRNVRAVDGVSFTIEAGTTVGLVGESGCGKTTIARLLLLLERLTAGSIEFDGRSLSALSGRDVRRYRQAVQIVFQDPYSSLNPRLRIRQIITEPITAHRRAGRRELGERVAELLELVGLRPETANQFPHELSGGQRQRVAIARALSLNPRLVVLDEPVSALDVSIRAQVINLLQDLQSRLGVAYLLIAHDLALVRHMATTTAVMYLGKIVEVAATDELFRNPRHPYTQALLSAVPVPDPDARARRIVLEGEVPSALEPPPGCSFHTRCPHAFDRCRIEEPKLVEVAPRWLARCHLVSTSDDRMPARST
jgi:peptide/nickel transport system ATP-binding protein/oligopeptide transport system ATP-binding protein